MSSVPTTPVTVTQKNKVSNDNSGLTLGGIGGVHGDSPSMSFTTSTPPPSTATPAHHPQMTAPTPPPQAFQSFPLSSGTIHPPSFSTPIKDQQQLQSTKNRANQEQKQQQQQLQQQEQQQQDCDSTSSPNLVSNLSKKESGNESSSGSSVVTVSTSAMTTPHSPSSSSSSIENNNFNSKRDQNSKKSSNYQSPTSTMASSPAVTAGATTAITSKVKGIDEFLNGVNTSTDSADIENTGNTNTSKRNSSNKSSSRRNGINSSQEKKDTAMAVIEEAAVSNRDQQSARDAVVVPESQSQSQPESQPQVEDSTLGVQSTKREKDISFAKDSSSAKDISLEIDDNDDEGENKYDEIPLGKSDVLNDSSRTTENNAADTSIVTSTHSAGVAAAAAAVATPKTANVDHHQSHSLPTKTDANANANEDGKNDVPSTKNDAPPSRSNHNDSNGDNNNSTKTNSKLLLEDNDGSISSSISNSNSRSLIPRSLDSGSEKTGSKKLVNMNLSLRPGGGSRSPSILSSQEGSSKESRELMEKNINRMKHLGLLLDRHHRQIKMRGRNSNSVDDDWLQNDSNNHSQSSKEYISSSSKEDRTSIESSEIGRNGGLAGYSIKSSEGSNNSNYVDSSSKSGVSSMTSPFNRRASTGASSVSSSGLDSQQTRFGRRLSLTSISIGEQGRKISDTLFDNFDKTWQSFHMTSKGSAQGLSLNEAFKREQLCFASMILVLFQHEQNKSMDSTAVKTKSVPLDVVKLFWEEVILSKAKVKDYNVVQVPGDCNVHSLADSIADFFLNKLHYITVETELPSEQSVDASSLRIKLSHDVYFEYSKHILEFYAQHNAQKLIWQWSAKFIDVLRDNLLADDKDDDTKGKVSQQVMNYAASQIPRLILQSFHTATSNNNDAQGTIPNNNHQQFQKERLGCFVSLMRNSDFLSKRMNILGANIEQQKDNSKQLKVEPNTVKATFDVLKATKAHLEDLELIHPVISLMSKETTIETEGGTFGVVEAVLSMYNAWKDLCLSIIQNSESPSLLTNPGVEGTVSTKKSNSKFSVEYSESQSHYTNHRAKKEYKLQPMIQASEITQSTLPKHFRLAEGEYKLQVDGFIISLEMMPAMNLQKTDRTKKGSIRRSESRRKPKKATMKLPDVLKIDPILLYHYLSVGKSINLLAKSISDATLHNGDSRSTGSGPKSLSGAMPNVSSIALSIAAIDIYMQLAHILSFILSSDVGDVDEDDLIDVGYYYDKDSKNLDPSTRLKKLFKDRNEARSLMEILNILCAESWLAIGTYVLTGLSDGNGSRIEMSAISLLNHLDEDAVGDVDPSNNMEEEDSPQSVLEESFKSTLQFKVLLCFQMALGILLHNSSFDKKGNRSSFQSELTNIVVHERNLKASIINSIGVHYYEQVGDYQRAKVCFDSSLASRRLLLRLLQRDEPDDLGNMSSSSIGSRSMKRNYKRSYQRSSRHANSRNKNKTNKQELVNSEKSDKIDAILSLETTRKKQVALIEKGLSTTLEFSALASHCLLDYETSLSLFQEALILRALYSGKDSLEVANLQYNMGVVHDDLAQYEASLGRYGESLRVRYTLLEGLKHDFSSGNTLSSPTLELVDIEASVVLTLRCMGNVYRALKDATNSIGCLMKAVEILKDKLKRRISDSSIGVYQSLDGDIGFGKGMVGPFLTLPMPNIILDELKRNEKNAPHNTKNFDEFSDSTTPSPEFEEDDMVRKDIANMYTTIITLVNERTAQVSTIKVHGKSGYTSSGSYSSSSSPVRRISTVKKSQKKGLEPTSDNDSIILDSTFNLGLLALHFKDYKNALHYFEEALRTLWTSFTGDSSGESSDSDFSSSKSSGNPSTSKTRLQKSHFGCQVEEGALYHALAIAHASLFDHERAIRCYVTALRYYRRRLGLESSTVAGALYDCAYSYWKLNDFEKAEDFWADCLKILLSCNGIIDSKAGSKSAVSPLYDLHVARTLYNLAASKICKDECNDEYIETCLNDASSILQRLSHKKTAQTYNNEIGHCYFYIGYVHYKKSLKMISATKRKSLDNLQGSSTQIKMKELKCKEGELYKALSCVDDSLNSYLAENGSIDVGLDEVEVGQKVKHPMQGHIAHLSAWIHDALGSVTQAQWNYKTAVRLLNKVYSPENIYSASAMHSLGNLYARINNPSEALKCYEDSLLQRAKILGSDHPAVADTLFNMAEIIGNIPDYTKATAMYTHCLKIRIMSEGNDGENVVTTLFRLALLHEKRGYLRKSQEYLEGALKVRRCRLHAIIHGCIANVEQTVEGGNNEAQEIERVTKEEQIQLATVLHHLGNVILKTGKTADSMSCYEEALSIRRKLCGMGTTGFAEYATQMDMESMNINRIILQDMADTLHNIGGVYETKNMPQKALGCYNQALIIKRSYSKEKKVEFSLEDQVKSCNTLSSAITLLRIGAIHNQLEDYDVALSYYKSALSIQRQHLGRDHIAVAQTLAEMGLISFRQLDNSIHTSNEEKAVLEATVIKRFNEALRISRLCHGPDHVSVAGVMYSIGSIHSCKGEYNKAIDYYQHSVKVYGRQYAKNLCRSLFDISSTQDNKYDEIVDNDHGLFHPTSFMNNISPLENRTSVIFSRGTTGSSSTINDIDREAYLKASLALAQVASRSGFVLFHGSAFQNLVLRFMHFIAQHGVDPIKGTLRKGLVTMLEHFTRASSHAIVTENPQNNYLYLIQE